MPGTAGANILGFQIDLEIHYLSSLVLRLSVSLIVVSMSIQVYSFTNANSTYTHYILSETIWQDILLCTFTLCVGIVCKCFSSILKPKPYDFFNFSLSRGENKYDI